MQMEYETFMILHQNVATYRKRWVVQDRYRKLIRRWDTRTWHK